LLTIPQGNRDFKQGFGEEYSFYIPDKKEDCLPNLKDLTVLIVHGLPVSLLIKFGDHTFYSILLIRAFRFFFTAQAHGKRSRALIALPSNFHDL